MENNSVAIGSVVRIQVNPRQTRLTGDYRERRIHEQFRKQVNGRAGTVVGFHYNLMNPIEVDVDGYGRATFAAADLTQV